MIHGRGDCVIMHCRLRRHKLFIFLKSDFGQQFKLRQCTVCDGTCTVCDGTGSNNSC